MVAQPREATRKAAPVCGPCEGSLAALAQPRAFPRNAIVYAAGDTAGQVYLIVSGEVKLTRCTADGRELTMEHLGHGALFGDVELLLGRPRECDATARTDLLLQVVEQDQLLAALESDPAFALWISRQMGERQARMAERLEALLFKSANGKVAQVLLNLARQHGEGTREGTMINYPITHQEIGNLIATTRETVSYAFMEFRQRGLISTRQRKTIVHDLEGLGQIAMN